MGAEVGNWHMVTDMLDQTNSVVRCVYWLLIWCVVRFAQHMSVSVIKTESVLTKIFDHIKKWICHTDRFQRERESLSKLIMWYRPTGTRNQGHPSLDGTMRQLKLEQVNRWPSPWQLDYDDIYSFFVVKISAFERMWASVISWSSHFTVQCLASLPVRFRALSLFCSTQWCNFIYIYRKLPHQCYSLDRNTSSLELGNVCLAQQFCCIHSVIASTFSVYKCLLLMLAYK
jgi:hypothetical protein